MIEDLPPRDRGRLSRRTLFQASAGTALGVTALGSTAAAAAGAAKAPAGVPFAIAPPTINAGTGGSPLTKSVKRALTTDVMPTDDPAFLDLFRRTTELAARMLRTESDVLLTHAEAIMVLEAAFSSLTRPGITALNLISGLYGAGYTPWFERYGANVIEVSVPFNESIDPAAVREALAAHPEVELMSVVDVDTPSGTKNPIDLICPIAKEYGVVSIVDSASTMGGEPLYPDRWGADVVIGASQKSLGSALGVGIISVSDAAWSLIEQNPNAPRESFLSLIDWKERWVENGVLPPGASPTINYSVYAALAQWFAIGRRQQFARHALAARAFRAGARAMGLSLWAASEEIAATTCTALLLPRGLTTAGVRQHLRQRYGLAMGGTVFSGDPAGQTIRVGHMGEQTDRRFVLRLLEVLGEGLNDLGASLEVGAGQAAARRVFRDG
jgi:pyridoxamine---pyruvate transaminase